MKGSGKSHRQLNELKMALLIEMLGLNDPSMGKRNYYLAKKNTKTGRLLLDMKKNGLVKHQKSNDSEVMIFKVTKKGMNLAQPEEAGQDRPHSLLYRIFHRHQ